MDVSNAELYKEKKFDMFRGPPRHVERVRSALDTYLEKVRDLRVAQANLLGRMSDMCPKTWPVLSELKAYLEDQSTLWGLAAADLRPMYNSLKKYSELVHNAKFTVEEFENRLMEVQTMRAEYELMKVSSNVSKTQQTQIEYMIRESNRALGLIRTRVEEVLLEFRKSQTELGGELIKKFEAVLRITFDEGIQVIDMITDRLGAAPIKKVNREGKASDDMMYVQAMVQSIVDRVQEQPLDLSAKASLYDIPPGIDTSRIFSNEALKNSTGNRSPYYTNSGHTPARISRPKTPPDANLSGTSILSWKTSSTTSNNSYHGFNPSPTSRAMLAGAIPFSSSRSGVRHVEAPSSRSNSGVSQSSSSRYATYSQQHQTSSPKGISHSPVSRFETPGQGQSKRSSRPSSPAGASPQQGAGSHTRQTSRPSSPRVTQYQNTQGQGHTQGRQVSRPSSPASSKGSYQGQGQTQGRQVSRPSSPASSRGSSRPPSRQKQTGSPASAFSPIVSEQSMEDLYNYCKPTKVKRRSSYRKTQNPFIPTSSVHDDMQAFYDCE